MRSVGEERAISDNRSSRREACRSVTVHRKFHVDFSAQPAAHTERLYVETSSLNAFLMRFSVHAVVQCHVFFRIFFTQVVFTARSVIAVGNFTVIIVICYICFMFTVFNLFATCTYAVQTYTDLHARGILNNVV